MATPERSAAPLEWHNWSRTVTAHPVRRERPADVASVAACVTRATRDGLRVKPMGSGHSFTAIGATDGVQLDLSGLTRLRSVDLATGLVTVEAGLPLHRLNPLLWDNGLAMANLGDIDRQTVGGAFATGTHGTGAAFGGLASQVHALELVLADGSVATCSRDERPDLFHAARVGLGAFGVVTAVTLACVPAFPLHAVERPAPLAEVLAGLDDLVAGHDHAEFYLFPHTTTALLKLNDRRATGAPLRPLPRWRALLDDEVLANGAFGAVCRVGAAWPSTIRRLNGLTTRLLSGREFTDRSYRVFVSRRRVVFREMEYAVPRESLRHVLGELGRWHDRPGHEIGFPVEVRFGPPEDAWLALAHDRETAYVAVHTYHRQPHQPYFRAVEAIAAEVGGRPHWGKLHDLDAGALRERYPRFDDAVAVRDAVDPGRVFANPYLDRVLGA